MQPVQTLGLTLGSRGSPLAIAQSRLTRRLLSDAHGVPEDSRDAVFPISAIVTTGDRITDRRLIDAGGKGLFTKEVEEALLGGRIDVAVHSMKDMPVVQPGGLVLAGFLPREDPREALIAGAIKTIADLPQNARIGTASLRRQAQVRRLRPDCRVETLRGNVGTRLEKIKDGTFDATFLALAGLNRLGLAHKASGIIEPEYMLPAPAQGAIGLQIRADDARTKAMLAPLLCEKTALALAAERAFLDALDGSCRTPIAALARLDDNHIHFRGAVFTPDGKTVWTSEKTIILNGDKRRAATALGENEGGLIAKAAGPKIKWES